ncbi:MAG: hypothetical protein JWN98_1007 [Abditibacteriota bacterium]|nr:hypothetical protein [Abditibacteriota bacterium]
MSKRKISFSPTISGRVLGRGLLLSAILVTLGLHARISHAQAMSYVRVLHANLNTPKVDYYLGSQKMLNDVTYAAVTKYQRVPSGRHYLRFTGNERGGTLATAYKTLQPGGFYTAILYGVSVRPRVVVQSEVYGSTPSARQSRVYFYHMSPGTPPLTLKALYADGRVRTLARYVPYARPRTFLAPEGDVTLHLYARNRLIRSQKSTLRPGRRHSYFIIGRIGAPGADNLRLMDEDAASQ